MTRPILPPDGKAYLSSVVMFELGLSPVIRDTYAALRVLAWGRAETPGLTDAELEHYTGKDPKTLYRHLPTLTTNGVLRVRHVSAGIRSVVFTDGISGADNCLKIETSQKREFPSIKESLKSKSPKNQKDLKVKEDSHILKIETSQKRETMTSPTRLIQNEYIRLLGYPIDNWGAGESKAAKEIGEHYSIEQFREAYQHFKAQPFWADKRVTLRYLKSQIAEYLAGKSNGRLPVGERKNVERKQYQPQPGNGVSDEGLAFIERVSGSAGANPKPD